MQQTVAGNGEVAGAEVEVFDYPACPGAPALPAWDGWAEAGDGPGPEPPQGRGKGAQGHAPHLEHAPRLEFDQRLGEETRKSFAAGHERGRQEGIEACRAAQATAVAEEAERRQRQFAGLVEKFAQERDRFLQAVEQEVVKLALAVAARILRREAQMDPLLLTGAVRVALGQLARSSEVRLQVPAAEVDLWTETMALVPNLALKPVVAAGEGMRLGDCIVDSKVGTVDLGIRSQLGEIERGFFDRAGASSPARTGSGAKEIAGAPNFAPGEAPQ